MSMTGLYVGSFNPFHKGHYDILCKAKDIFDDVIIGVGVNAKKDSKNQYLLVADELSLKLPNDIIMPYSGLVTDFITGLEKDWGGVTLVRGLRNSKDLENEQDYYRYLKDIKPNIKMVTIFSDEKYLHYSSSSIKTLPVELKKNI